VTDPIALLRRSGCKTFEFKRDLCTHDGFSRTLVAFAGNCGRRGFDRSRTASVYSYLTGRTFRYPVPEEESSLTKHAMSLALALMILCAFGAVAADVTGTWFGRVEMGPGRVMEQTIILKMEGGKLTGAVKTASGEMEISDGRINGDEVSFTATREAGGNKMKMVYKGKISGNEIKFLHGREGGQQREFTVKRTSS
jgi:hypothetical protein